MDSSRYKINKMLFIKNVSLDECKSIDDIFEEKIMTQANELPHVGQKFICSNNASDNSSNTNHTNTNQHSTNHQKKQIRSASHSIWELDSKNMTCYEKLPYIFTGMNTWQKKTNLHCWYCGLAFDDVPIFVPKSIEPNNNMSSNQLQLDNQLHLLSEHSVSLLATMMSNNQESKYAMNREGCFCSFHCALVYIDLYYPKPHENVDKRGMLEILFYEMYNIHPQKLYKAPSKYDMIQYGGTLTPNEYKKKIQELQDESGITAIMRIKCKESSFKNQS